MTRGSPVQAAIWGAAGLALLATTAWVWWSLHGSWALPLGAIRIPTPGHLMFMALWSLGGGAGAVLLAGGIVRLGSAEHRRAVGWVRSVPTPVFVGAGTVSAAVLAGWVAVAVLLGGPITDDATVYRFMAQLVGHGQLTGRVPADPVFWDRAFMVTDDRWYGHFFMGWPILLAPFERVGLGLLANPILHAGTVPAVYWIARRAVGEVWARTAMGLFVLSPFALLVSGTLLAHTATLFFLAWALVGLLRALDERPPGWSHALFAVGLCLAFWCRPLTAIGFGTPWLAMWLVSIVRRRSWASFAIFAVPVLILAAGFLAVVAAQTGSPFRPSYAALVADAEASGWRFAHLRKSSGGWVDGLRLWNPPPLTSIVQGLLRFSVVAWGIPLAIVAVIRVPWRAREAGVHLAAVAGFCVSHAFMGDPGIDTVGPVHLYELLLPLTVLLVLAAERSARIDGAWPGALLVAGVLASILVYLPVRMWTAHQVAVGVHRTTDAIAAVPAPAIIYVPMGPFTRPCQPGDPLPFVFWRLNPDPWLSGPRLMANHLDVGLDRAHRAEHFPDRNAYIMVRPVDACVPTLVDLDSAQADLIPAGRQRLPGPEEAVDPAVLELP